MTNEAKPTLSPKGEAEAVAWRDIATEPRVQEIGHLWLAADAYGKVFPGVFVGHRIPRDAILVFRVPDPKAHPSAQPKADREAWSDADIERAAQALVDYEWGGSQPGFASKPPRWKLYHVYAVRAVLAALTTQGDAG